MFDLENQESYLNAKQNELISTIIEKVVTKTLENTSVSTSSEFEETKIPCKLITQDKLTNFILVLSIIICSFYI